MYYTRLCTGRLCYLSFQGLCPSQPVCGVFGDPPGAGGRFEGASLSQLPFLSIIHSLATIQRRASNSTLIYRSCVSRNDTCSPCRALEGVYEAPVSGDRSCPETRTPLSAFFQHLISFDVVRFLSRCFVDPGPLRNFSHHLSQPIITTRQI